MKENLSPKSIETNLKAFEIGFAEVKINIGKDVIFKIYIIFQRYLASFI